MAMTRWPLKLLYSYSTGQSKSCGCAWVQQTPWGRGTDVFELEYSLHNPLCSWGHGLKNMKSQTEQCKGTRLRGPPKSNPSPDLTCSFIPNQVEVSRDSCSRKLLTSWEAGEREVNMSIFLRQNSKPLFWCERPCLGREKEANEYLFLHVSDF